MTGAGRAFDLGGWRIDPATGTLSRDGHESRIEPRLMELLLLFAASPGRVISKDEIIASVWGGRAIGDDTLAATISRLRTALGESTRFIETLPKRGYRLLIVPDGFAAPAPSAPDGIAALIAKGRAALLVALPQSLAQARVYFEAAIAADSKSAAAQAGLAEAMLAQHAAGQGASFAASARAAAQAATALDPDLATAWATLGAATLIADRDFAAAEAALLRALALDRKAARTHRVYAFALAAVGRFPQASARLAWRSKAMRCRCPRTSIWCRYSSSRIASRPHWPKRRKPCRSAPRPRAPGARSAGHRRCSARSAMRRTRCSKASASRAPTPRRWRS
jgi:hypothetical protein